MKLKLFVLTFIFMSIFTTIDSTNMIIKQKDGKIVKFNVDDVKSVSYLVVSDHVDPDAIDASSILLKFNILSDSTVEVTKDFSYCDIDTISIPSKVKIDGDVYKVTSIDSWAFAGFSSFSDIVVPSSVNTIGEYAFSDCKNLNVIIENKKENVKVGEFAFQGCKSVTFKK